MDQPDIQKDKTLYQQLSGENVLLIPDYQRDYAQGRSGNKRTEDIRKKFVEDLYDALTQENRICHLGLVYGAPKQPSGGFVAVDGQQRLTTVFLLHWYILKRTERVCDFNDELLSRLKNFKWAVRQYSSEFFDFLQNLDLSSCPTKGAKGELSTYLRQCAGFHEIWLRDPSVKSVICMLDCLHEKFYNADIVGIRYKLHSPSSPVRFDFLPLAEGSDEFQYLKMNSRGRSLTTFEQFKSKFQEKADVRHNSELKKKMDNEWLTLAMNIACHETFVEPDIVYMNLINELTLFSIYRHDESGKEYTKAITDSKPNPNEKRTDVGFVPFKTYEALNISDFAPIMDWLSCLWPILKQYKTMGRPFQCCNAKRLVQLLQGISGSPTYSTRALFAALLLYREACPEIPNEANIDSLFRWTRIFTNLINATVINDGNFSDIIKSIKNVSHTEIYKYLVEQPRLGTFNGEQQEEEQAKIRAIKQNDVLNEEYEDLLTELESEDRFKSQIRVLGFYKDSHPIHLDQFRERVKLFNNLYENWFQKNDWLFAQAVLTFAAAEPLETVICLKENKDNIRNDKLVTRWINQLLEHAQSSGDALEIMFKKRKTEWLNEYPHRPYKERKDLYWVYYLLRDKDGEAQETFRSSDYAQIKGINPRTEYYTLWLYHKTYKNNEDMLISNKRHDIIEAVAGGSIPREETHGKYAYEMPYPNSHLRVRFTPHDIHVGLPSDSMEDVPASLPTGYWSEDGWKALKWMPHNNKFFFEGETESFEKYRDDLVEQLRKFVEDVQGELGLSKV